MPMMGWGGGYGGSGEWFMLLFGGVIVVALLVFLFRMLSWTGPAHHTASMPPIIRGSAGLHTLDERYARGEVSRDEYLQKKRDILG